MAKAYVLMTAMPPTKGHMHLIEFAQQIGSTAEVIVATQPSEPFAFERVAAIREATRSMRVNVHHIHRELPQEPVGGAFWDMWADFLRMFGIQPMDYIVASEMYGQKLADWLGPDYRFIPYDIERDIYYSKATEVRLSPTLHFDTILPEFQHYLRMTVTIFGAESTGKTTLSKDIAQFISGGAQWLPEWARPYMENLSITENTVDSMTDIWVGQKALQLSTQQWVEDKAYIIQDTDLYSTVGYWKMYEHELGGVPYGLAWDAYNAQSHLYIVTNSGIPFEPDPLRFGGDVRESSDQFWIDLLESYNLDYVYLTSTDKRARLTESLAAIAGWRNDNISMAYERKGQ